MGYRNFVKEHALPTGIHTWINKDFRISSVYRRFGNEHFESYGWETILWNGEHIDNQYDVIESADLVIDLHAKILKSFLKEES